MLDYIYNLNRLRGFLFSPLLSIVSLVAVLSFFDFFNSDAGIEYEIKHVNVTYDTDGIIDDLITYKVNLPLSEILRHRKDIRIPSKQKDSFKERLFSEHANQFSRSLGDLGYYDRIKKALVYNFEERAASSRRVFSAHISNRSFWESSILKQLETLVDTVTFIQVLHIIISRRVVTVQLHIGNSGDADAKNIKVFLQNPFLLKPRTMLTEAIVEFIQIESDQYIAEIENNGTNAKISIPFLAVGNYQSFQVTSSMTNLNNDNVFIDFETDRKVRVTRVLVILLIVSSLFYSIPLLMGIFDKKSVRTN